MASEVAIEKKEMKYNDDRQSFVYITLGIYVHIYFLYPWIRVFCFFSFFFITSDKLINYASGKK